MPPVGTPNLTDEEWSEVRNLALIICREETGGNQFMAAVIAFCRWAQMTERAIEIEPEPEPTQAVVH